MMTYREFCEQIAPSILELQNECREMSEDEFKDFREETMQAVGKPDLIGEFMGAVLDLISHNIF